MSLLGLLLVTSPLKIATNSSSLDRTLFLVKPMLFLIEIKGIKTLNNPIGIILLFIYLFIPYTKKIT